ncbi:hypothetical protein BGZ96_006504 [Linnemannia gamsii]|uniref:Up-regulated during septation protein 1 domain-containing protein n=1 Tax=Linnemannia gamsii TaxID=64522 RepID=A0ABQ7K2T5_9FUNG|nr:hypothetical protein BGZ96_006504 [Linnemannia gamsii]
MTDTDTIHTIPALLEEQESKQPRRPARLPPSRVYTINTSHQESTKAGPKTAPIGLSPSPFRHSNHSTGNIITHNSNPHSDIISRARSLSTSSNNNNNSKNNGIASRSRSFSTSNGGVIPRPRADSEASRLALEALIQKRLDRITQRLDEFNFESHELYARTETLAKSFHDNAKRLYKVEDHLLRVQGKPGLSDAYLENGGPPQRRRLTHDLEELRMGVKTLRKKFQVAGSVVSTVEWWKRLKDDEGQQSATGGGVGDDSNPAHTEDDQSLKDLAVSSSPNSPSPLSASTSPNIVYGSRSSSSSSSPSFSRTVSRKEGQALQKIMTAPDATATIYDSPSTTTQDTVSSPDFLLPHGAAPAQGLRSPPLTPKGPPSLLGSFLQRGHLDDVLHIPTNIKARPLSVIPDMDEPLQLPLSPPTTTWTEETTTTTTDFTAPAPLIDDMHLDKEDHVILHQSASSTVQSSPQSNNNHNNNDYDKDESRPVFLEIFTPPSLAALSSASASAETAETVTRSTTEPMLKVEKITGVEKAGCEEELLHDNAPIEQASDDNDDGDKETTDDNFAHEEFTASDTVYQHSEHPKATTVTPILVSGADIDGDNEKSEKSTSQIA